MRGRVDSRVPGVYGRRTAGMNVYDILILAAVAAAAVAAFLKVRRSGTSCGACGSCPASIYCRKRKN